MKHLIPIEKSYYTIIVANINLLLKLYHYAKNRKKPPIKAAYQVIH